MDQAYEMFHEVLVKLFNDIMNIEAKAILTPEFRDITNNDMHVIEAVGIRDRKSTRLNSSHIEESRMPSSA